MTTDRRKRIQLERQARRIANAPMIEIYKDNDLVFAENGVVEAIHFIREWLLKTPFWEITQLTVNFYKKFRSNEDYAHRNDKKVEESHEKNLMFKNDNRKYLCLRCKKESEICGFCRVCYNEVYGLDRYAPVAVKIEDVKCNEKFMRVAENDRKYTEEIKQSIIHDGMKNPIILDKENRILIGHHRYYIAKELGWDTIQAIYNPIKFGHNYFYEGKGCALFIGKIDGNLEASTTDPEIIIRLLMDFDVQASEGTLVAEFFLNIGSDIRLRNVFIPERGHIVDQTWLEWWTNKFGKDPR